MSPHPSTPKARAGVVVLIVLSAVVLGIPVAGLAFDIVKGLLAPKVGDWWWVSPAAVVRSAGWAVVIGVLAAGLGLPIAWVCRRARARAAGLLLAPALLPGFLAYSGWGMLRAPLSVTGDWIDRQRQAGWDWLPHTVDTVLAIGGLALWAAPLAGACMLPGVRTVTDDLLDAARLEARGVRSLRVVLPALARPFAFGAGAVAALMLGSAIPLHLARVDTAAIALWAQMDLTPPDRHWQVWVAGWPLVLAAAGFAWATGRMGARVGETALAAPNASERGAPWSVRVLAAGVVVLGALVPLGLFAAELKTPTSIPRYWRSHHEAITTSAGLAVLVGGACVVLAVAAWHAGTTGGPGRRRVLGWLAAGWTAAGLLPGVMAGSAVARGFNLLAWALPERLDPSDTVLPIAAAHVARLGFLAVWLGVWLAGSEPSEAGDARRLDGAEHFPGWVPGTLAGRAGALGGLFAVAFALSLHEIEASVLTLWPGGSLLGRQLLNDLHFFRTEELAAGVVLVAMGLVPSAAGLAVAAAVLRAAPARREG